MKEDPENVELLQRATIALALEGRMSEAAALAERLESLTAGASVSELVELRAELMMQGRLP